MVRSKGWSSPHLLGAWVVVFLYALNGVTLTGADLQPASNLDFEQGTKGWSVWYSDDPKAVMTRYPWAADDSVAHGGKQSLKITAPDEAGCAFVSRRIDGIRPEAAYEISYWIRKSESLDEANFSVRLNFRPANAAKVEWKMKTEEVTPVRRRDLGEWQFRSGKIRVPKGSDRSASLGLYLRGARGTVWIDDVSVREIPASERKIADLWEYDPFRVDLGGAPLKKFQAFADRKDPILARAARYNALLVRSARAKEDVRRCLRLRPWAGSANQDAKTLASNFASAEEDLAVLYRAYGEAFHDPASDSKADDYERKAASLDNKLATLEDAAASFLASATRLQRDSGKVWQPPPLSGEPGLPEISPEGKVNQIIYGNRSIWSFQDLERPLAFAPLHSTTVGTPRSDAPGRYDWSAYDKQWDEIRSAGLAKRSCLLLFMTLHDGCYAPGWLRARQKEDPELFHVVPPPAQIQSKGDQAPLNWWHPGVRAYAEEVVSDMGRTFSKRPEFLFYEYQWETYGPFVRTEKGPHQVGYGHHAERDFRLWLEKKYASVEALNRRWGTRHGSFEDIKPPPDKRTSERRHADPLAAEWEAWREKSFEDWCRLIYQAWKRADPGKPVFADPSSLFRSYSMPNAFETCDILGFHNSGRTFMPTLFYINGISRHNGFRPLGQYENFWGVQEDHGRMFDELARRHGTQKHIFRLTMWNMFLQIWWYSYTAADYLTHYDGNYFDPAYALTTLRYRSAALPVYFDKFRRLQRALLDSRVVAPRLAMLAPTASMRNNFPEGASQTEAVDLFWELFPRNDIFDLFPEEYVLDGRARLEDFDALILPYALYMSAPLRERIENWLKERPRLLVAAGPFGLHDEIGQPAGELLATAFGKDMIRPLESITAKWAWTDGGDAGDPFRTAQVGPSKVVLLLKPVSQCRGLAGFKDRVVAPIEACARRYAWDDANAFELVLREQGDIRYLGVLNPNPDKASDGNIHVAGGFQNVTDLDYPEGLPIPATIDDNHTVFRLHLEPGEATILRLLPWSPDLCADEPGRGSR